MKYSSIVVLSLVVLGIGEVLPVPTGDCKQKTSCRECLKTNGCVYLLSETGTCASQKEAKTLSGESSVEVTNISACDDRNPVPQKNGEVGRDSRPVEVTNIVMDKNNSTTTEEPGTTTTNGTSEMTTSTAAVDTLPTNTTPTDTTPTDTTPMSTVPMSTSTELTTEIPETTTEPTTIPSTETTTTEKPAPTSAPHAHFHVPSFIGGIVLTVGIIAIVFVVYKFYKARKDRNYHTLHETA